MADYSDIHSEALYYVPLDCSYEVWNLKLTNNSSKARSLTLTGYAEFTNNSNYEQDQVNLQYTLFITRTYFKFDNMIVQTINENTGKNEKGSNGRERFIGLAGAPVTSYNGDKDAFIGRYHNYGNPIAVENGKCDNVLNYNANGCGALHTALELQPGETKEVAFILGQATPTVAKQIVDNYLDPSVADKEVEELKKYWHAKLANFQVNTPSASFNSMINTWNAYQCFITFTWSRAASFQYCGERNGYGYRDTVQDIQGIIHLDPEMAANQIRFMLSAQVNHGGGLPLVKFDHNAGHEDTPEDESYVRATGHPAYRADDALWLFPTVWKYVAETGNKDFIKEVIPYANKEEGTVYDHLKRAINFSMERLGDHKMPAGLHADWNDCLNLNCFSKTPGESFQTTANYESGVAESVFIAGMFVAVGEDYQSLMKMAGLESEIDFAKVECKKMYDAVMTDGWDGEWFVRAYDAFGNKVGSHENEDGQIYIEPQGFCVMAGIGIEEGYAEKALNSVRDRLETKYGISLLAPTYKEYHVELGEVTSYPPSYKENGGIFCHNNPWITIAETKLGRGDRAYLTYKNVCPAYTEDISEIHKMEPYVYAQMIASSDAVNQGQAKNSWLTGTSSWTLYSVTQYILGVRPTFDGLMIDPCIPAEWDGFTVTRKFRGDTFNITVKNPNGSMKGVKSVTVDGNAIDGNVVKVFGDGKTHEVIVEM